MDGKISCVIIELVTEVYMENDSRKTLLIGRF